MNNPTASQPYTQRHLSRYPTARQPLPNGISAVAPNGISAVSQRLRYRLRLDFQVGLRHRRDFAGLIYSADRQGSTRRCRVTSAAATQQVNQKLKHCGAYGVRP